LSEKTIQECRSAHKKAHPPAGERADDAGTDPVLRGWIDGKLREFHIVKVACAYTRADLIVQRSKDCGSKHRAKAKQYEDRKPSHVLPQLF